MNDQIEPAAQIPPSPIAPPPPKKNHKRKKAILIVLWIFLIIGLVWAAAWWFIFREEQYTDDAYVAGNRVLLKPQVEAMVTAFFTDDNDFVEEGQVLVTLDETLFALALEAEKKELALAVRQAVALKATTAALEADLKTSAANLRKTNDDYHNRLAVISSLAVSKEDLEHAKAAFDAAQAAYASQEFRYLSSLASLGQGPIEQHPLITSQQEKVRKAFVDLHHCQVLAPATGYVAKRSVQVGDFATPTVPLLSIIPLDQMWIEANFKENQLKYVRIGQPVTVKVDLYGHKPCFEGRVSGILMGTGSVFSLLPAQNATGNWIKIVQRVPVRIELRKEDLLNYPLRLGLSCETTIDITTTEGDVLRPPRELQVVEKTEIFSVDMEGIEKEMNQIIQGNIFQ